MYLKIKNASVSVGGNTIIENVDFEVRDGEKIGIVGRNGSGKTTLLRALIGQLPFENSDNGEPKSVVKVGSPVVGHLQQVAFNDEEKTVEDELLEVFKDVLTIGEQMNKLLSEIEKNADTDKIEKYNALKEKYELLGGTTYRKEYCTMLDKFGFSQSDLTRKIGEFSGGQRTKLAFIKLLLSMPDILLLDEPTNHLDLKTIEWLEEYLKKYKSAVIVISHDRMFLNRIVQKVYEIEYGEMYAYTGNYAAYEQQKEQRKIQQQKNHELQKAEIERITAFIERFRYKATKAKTVQSRIKQLERMKIIDAPESDDTGTYSAKMQPRIKSSRNVLNVKELKIGYDKPLAEVSFNLESGNKLGIIGGNGTGKSTLLKTLMGMVEPLGGEYLWGYNVEKGYFDQQTAQSNSGLTVLDNFREEFPFAGDTEARKALAAFRFTGDDVFKQVKSLSGGEKVALSLCKIFRKQPNVLIMDEPTNHMDIVGKETLEKLLKDYEGTVIFVSHDRYFVDKIATSILAFEGSGAEYFTGTYGEYENALKERESESDNSVKKKATESTAVKTEKKTHYSPSKMQEKRKKRLAKIEEQIAEAEKKVSELNELLNDPSVYGDYVKIIEIEGQIAEWTKKQEEYMEEWVSLGDEIALHDEG